MFFWVINANAWKAGFWMLVHIIKDPNLTSTILEEISPYVSPTMSLESVELANKLHDCPTFMSAYHETLRISSSSMTIRYVMEDSYVRGFKLEKGAKVMIPYRQVMLDENIYGHNAEQYNHEQFLRNPALLKSLNFKPFGGGVTLCPGRTLAQKEVLTFVALALGKFRVRLPTNDQAGVRPLPKIKTRTPCLGIMGPEAGEDIAVTISKPQY
jgi:cytochrome P450